jgi:hypothetical protein
VVLIDTVDRPIVSGKIFLRKMVEAYKEENKKKQHTVSDSTLFIRNRSNLTHLLLKDSKFRNGNKN